MPPQQTTQDTAAKTSADHKAQDRSKPQEATQQQPEAETEQSAVQSEVQQVQPEPEEDSCSPASIRGGMDVYADNIDRLDEEEGFVHRRTLSRSVHWSIAWSDLMMTMFILFMVMFIYKKADREFLGGEGLGHFPVDEVGREQGDHGPLQESAGQGQDMKAMSRLYDFSEVNLEEQDLQEFAEIDLEPDRTVRIILTGDLIFPLGKSEIRPGSKEALGKIAIFLKETPYKINVIGHTDSLPIHSKDIPSNWELSANRACAVARFLIEKTKLPPEQFYVTGHAEYRPVAPNDNPQQRALNRRVEVVITKEIPGAVPVGGADL